MNCEICNKSFTGLVCYQQHEASEKHKKKMKLHHIEVPNGTSLNTSTSNQQELELIHCSACSISVRGLLEFQKHANSLQHADMVKEKSENSEGECEFEYHPEEPQTVNLNQYTIAGPSKILNTYAQCDLCQKQFSGPEPYLQHIDSAGHKKKCALREQDMNDEVDGEQWIEFQRKMGVQAINSGINTPRAYAKCEHCNMQFSGPEPHQLHLDSAAHKKKAAMQLDSNILTAKSQNGTLNSPRCAICDKDFSGPIPYNQHMESNIHKKKLLNLEQRGILVNHNDSLLPDSTTHNFTFNTELNSSNQKWYCEVCKKRCSGPIPYNQHIVSETHCKSIRAAKVEEKLKNIDPSDQFSKNEMNELSKDSQKNDSNFADCINDDKTNEFNKDFRIRKDLIFCDALKNVGLIPPEDMNISVFYPDQEIVFDSPSKKNNTEMKYYVDFDLDESP